MRVLVLATLALLAPFAAAAASSIVVDVWQESTNDFRGRMTACSDAPGHVAVVGRHYLTGTEGAVPVDDPPYFALVPTFQAGLPGCRHRAELDIDPVIVYDVNFEQCFDVQAAFVTVAPEAATAQDRSCS